jgi:hypothetical protein
MDKAKPTSRTKDSGKPRRKIKKSPAAPASGEVRSSEPSTLEGGVFRTTMPGRPRRGTGATSAGQSGDIQGLSRIQDVDSESVEELLEEGQSYEASIVSGVEGAPDPDQGEVRTREISADDVPEEYIDKD